MPYYMDRSNLGLSVLLMGRLLTDPKNSRVHKSPLLWFKPTTSGLPAQLSDHEATTTSIDHI